MNPLLAISIMLAAIASAPNLSAGGDAIDSPGPGYREQIDSQSAPSDRIAPVKVRVEPGIVVGAWQPREETDFIASDYDTERDIGTGRSLFTFSWIIQKAYAALDASARADRSLFSLPYIIQKAQTPPVHPVTLILEATGNADIYEWEDFTPCMVFLPNQNDLSLGALELSTWRLTCRIMHPRPPISW